MIEADHHLSLHVDFGKFLPKLASYVNYLFADYFHPDLISTI